MAKKNEELQSFTIDDDMFDINMAAFKNLIPEVYQQLEHYKPQSELFSHPSGFDVRFSGVELYGRGAEKYCEDQVEAYFKAQNRITTFSPEKSSLDEFADHYVLNMSDRFIKADIEILDYPCQDKTFHFIVFGVGLGFHLSLFEERTACRNLIIIEPNLEFLYQSLHVFDWDSLLKKMFHDGRTIHIIISNSPEAISEAIRIQMRQRNPAYIDGTYIFIHYQNAIFNTAAKLFKEDAMLLLVGLGFVRDEIGMITNTFRNLKNGKQRIHNKNQGAQGNKMERSQTPVFIIGAGPSIDDDLPFIKANADKAIIVSCGTGLRPLLNAGIKPDYHAEIERGVPPYEVLHNLSKEFDLSGIVLMASSTCNPEIKTLFDDNIFYFRAALSSYPIFGVPSAILDMPGPTVANTGFTLSQELGFKNFYTFGIDFGTRDPEVHHSLNSDYYGKLDILEEKKYDMPVPANFGGLAMTGSILYWAKDSMEQRIQKFSRNNYYNCSDGVMIKRMIPKRSETIKLTHVLDKPTIMGTILENSPVYDHEMFLDAWERADMSKEIFRFIDDVKEIINLCDKNDYISMISDIVAFMVKTDEIHTPSRILANRGTAFMLLGSAAYYMNRVADEERMAEACEIFVEEMYKELDIIREAIGERMNELDQELEDYLS